MSATDRAFGTVPEQSVWAGWQLAEAEAWAEALLGFERYRLTSTVKPMLLLVLWHDWHERRALPELRRWERLAARFEAHGVSADAFVRFHEAAGVPRWSPVVERPDRRPVERRRPSHATSQPAAQRLAAPTAV